jgi:hypothetical protein
MVVELRDQLTGFLKNEGVVELTKTNPTPKGMDDDTVGDADAGD